MVEENNFRETKTHIYFWGSIYSQWYTSKNQFKEDGFIFQNAEQYMMMKKAELFKDYDVLEKMKQTSNPKVLKKLGREIKGFDEDIWNFNKMDIVERGNFLKFSQNPKLLEKLIAHKNKHIVEASPYDKIWGIGLHWSDDKVLNESTWNGENLLGKCIMSARDKILNPKSI